MKSNLLLISCVVLMAPVFISCVFQPVNQNQSNQSLGVYKKMTFNDFNSSIHLIKEGMSEKQVFKILGEPTRREEHLWTYNNFPDARMPVAGETLFFGATIEFETHLVKAINLSWMDSTGPAPE